MIHSRVTVFFQPAAGTAADAVAAANQQVMIDLAAGTMSAARTDAKGLLVTGAPSAPVPLDDARTYSVLVQSSFTGPTPAASAGATLRVASGKLMVTPKIAIRVTTGATAPAAALACQLTIGTTTTAVTTSATGWILSNDQTSGAATLTSATRLLRLVSGTAPAATLALASTPATRNDTVRTNITGPTGTVGLHVTDWRYAISYTNPDGSSVTGTVIRPSTEDPSNVDKFWEGTMCASGTVTASFVTGVTVRASGAAAIAVILVAMDPQTATLAVTVAARAWKTPLTKNAEGTLTKPIRTFHDTGQHDWTAPSPSASDSTIATGPNRGCRFVASTGGMGFTSTPKINADVVNLTSTFQSAQGSVRVLAPPRVRGQILTPPLVTITGSTFSIPNGGAVATSLGLTAAEGAQFQAKLCVKPADLLAGTRAHEHLGPISHKMNALAALRALEPSVFIEGFVQGPAGAALDFNKLLLDRVTKVKDAGVTHDAIDESATKTAGVLKFTGSKIPKVNVDSAGKVMATWNPLANDEMT